MGANIMTNENEKQQNSQTSVPRYIPVGRDLKIIFSEITGHYNLWTRYRSCWFSHKSFRSTTKKGKKTLFAIRVEQLIQNQKEQENETSHCTNNS